MKFGVFDHVDCSGVPLAEHLENRLRIAEVYDRCGIHGYHVAEHHSTPLGFATSPSVFLSSVIQRTKRLRIGPLVYLLPLYHPLRLIEEVAMLDNLSNGRFMLGVGRGVSPVEMGFYGVPTQEQQSMYDENLEILLKGLSSDVLDYSGKYHSFNDVPMTMRPIQQPHPELWYGGRSPESFAWAARNKVNVVTLALDEEVRQLTDVYRSVWAEGGGTNVDMPMLGVSRHIFVADTDAEAQRTASQAYEKWRNNLYFLWDRKGIARPMANIYPDSWEELEAIGNGCAGTPDKVRKFAIEEAERGGINYLVSWFAFGDLSVGQVTRSVELFSQHVMSAFESSAKAA